MTRTKPYFSVIIPVYNAENYLPQCIESVLKQNYSNFEMILINDGSQDSSGLICDDYQKQDNRIRVYHQGNLGAATARNKGIVRANGEYILFLDSDDYWVDNCLSKIASRLKEKEEKVDVLFLHHAKVTSNGELSAFEGYSFDSLNQKGLADYILTQKKVDVSACFKVMKRELFTDSRLYFTDSLLAEDIDWFFKLITLAQHYSTYEGGFYCYRMTEHSVSSITNEKRMKDYLFILKKWIALADNYYSVGIQSHHFYYMVGYEYEVLLAGLYNYSSDVRKKYKLELMDLFWLLDYRSGRRSQLIKTFQRLVGFNGLCKILNLYLRHRILKTKPLSKTS